jgi:hypothetical protein
VKTESHETRKKFEKKERKTNYLLPRMRKERKKMREKNGLSGKKNWQLRPDGNFFF